MKKNMIFLIAVLLFSTVAPTNAVFQPLKISFTALVDPDSTLELTFVEALSEHGIISISDIPNFESKLDALSNLHDCVIRSNASQEFTFPDGTRRRTMATRSIPDGIQTISHEVSSEQCKFFDEAAQTFRLSVATVTQIFADRLAQFFQGPDTKSTLLSTRSGFSFKTFSEVVEMGEHLEHFHLYEKLVESQEQNDTIEMHVDQGLFIAFTPGLMINQQDNSTPRTTSGFFIELKDGHIEEVEFDSHDDLVFMIGDGVNQYINDKLSSKKLRAVPHTLRMNSHPDSFHRVWYGRMVLPPVDAVHPTHSLTFEELRNKMIASSLTDQEFENTGLGCSSGMMARDLSAVTCEGESFYCWHRCMNFTDYEGVSNEECSLLGLNVECINPRNQLWSGDTHGDYFPACANATLLEVETPVPTLDEYPRSNNSCTDAGFESFAAATGYDNSHNLPGGARFLWSIEDNAVRGRVAYNGLFGWLAFGFADIEGEKNGMHGANILMALPGGDFSPATGLDLSLEENVNEYEIHPTESAFRFWMSPLSTTKSIDETDIESTECYTAMTFKASTIGSYTFNLTGKDELIWAANGMDYFVGYHQVRGRFAVDWEEALVTYEGHEHEHDDDHVKDAEKNEDVTSIAAPSLVNRTLLTISLSIGLMLILS